MVTTITFQFRTCGIGMLLLYQLACAVKLRTESAEDRPSSRILSFRHYGDCALSLGGPLLWNAVPLHLKETNSVHNSKSLFENIPPPPNIITIESNYIRCSPLFLFSLLTFFLSSISGSVMRFIKTVVIIII